jgi:23S rRNA (uridine2552-2'-O)-methyltransferase
MKGRPDHYWRKSKEQGYPARSVWKLREMQDRFRLVPPGSRVLDLGCSPGSWSLGVLEMLGGRGEVLGVDLDDPDRKLLSRPGFAFIRGDFTTPEVIGRIVALGSRDVVLSDAAPSTSGNRIRDTSRSLELCLGVLAVADACLAPGGNLALKIFQGGEERRVLQEIQRRFAEARVFKPKASRTDSMEVYIIGLRRRAPSGTVSA